jgi:hypothetical protein
MTDGIPDDAFRPVEGDDKEWAASLRRINAKDNAQQAELFADQDIFVETVVNEIDFLEWRRQAASRGRRASDAA